MKILLVDDEQKFVSMLAKRLALRNIPADVVFTGDDAIQAAEKNTYDVAVLDIKMPGISGVQLKKRLHAIHPEMKFIFVTGHGSVEKAENGSDANDLYLSKPLDLDFLIETLNTMIQAEP